MVSSTNEYLQMLANIQNDAHVLPITVQSGEPMFVVDLNTRNIEVPLEFSAFMAIQNDHNAETVYFLTDRYFDDKDLADYTAVVQYVNGKGENGVSLLSERDLVTYVDDGKMILGWKLDNSVTRNAGSISYAIRFYKLDDENKFIFSLNTKTQTSAVVTTLDVMDNISVSSDVASTLLTQLIEQVNNIGVTGGTSGGSGTTNYNSLLNKPTLNGHTISGAIELSIAENGDLILSFE